MSNTNDNKDKNHKVNKEVKETKEAKEVKKDASNNSNEKALKGVKVTKIIIAILVVLTVILIGYYIYSIYASNITDTIKVAKYNDQNYFVVTDEFKEEYYSYNIKIASPEVNKNYNEDVKLYKEYPYTVNKVMNYDEYVAYCETLNLATKYEDKNKNYMVLSGIYKVKDDDYSIAGIEYNEENNATIYLKNNDSVNKDLSNSSDEIFIFIIPTDNKVNNVSYETAISLDTFEALKNK